MESRKKISARHAQLLQQVFQEMQPYEYGSISYNDAKNALIAFANNNDIHKLSIAAETFKQIAKLDSVSASPLQFLHPLQTNTLIISNICGLAYLDFCKNPIDERILPRIKKESEHASQDAKIAHRQHSFFGRVLHTRCDLEKAIEAVAQPRLA